MRKLLFISLAIVALLCLSIVPSADAEAGWSSSVSPSFVFNGDEVTVKVTGIPGSFAFVKVMLVNETLDDQLVFLDDMGNGQFNWSVPILAETGIYKFVVVSNGLNVTEASLSVIFDDVTYLRWRVDGVEGDNAQLRDMVQNAIIEVEDVHSRLFWIWAGAVIGIAGCVCFGTITLMFYLPALKFRLDEMSRVKGLRGKLGRTYQAMFDPEISGVMLRAWPTMYAEKKREKAKIRAKDGPPYVVIPDTSEPLGYRVFAITEEPPEMTEDEAEPVEEPTDDVEDEVQEEEVPKMKFLEKLKARRAERTPAAVETVPLSEYAALKVRLDALEKEQRSRTPERVEQPPKPSAVVGTTPEKPSAAVPAPIQEIIEIEAEDVPKPRKRASATKPKAAPRKKRAAAPNDEAVQ